MYKKILVAIDKREMAMTALEQARNLAVAFEGELVLLHVYSSKAKASQHKRLGLISGNRETESAALANQVLEIMVGSPIKFKMLTATGKAATKILEVAEEENCDAIVMGSRGLSTMEKIFIGSVSSEVMNKAEVPVLIVK